MARILPQVLRHPDGGTPGRADRTRALFRAGPGADMMTWTIVQIPGSVRMAYLPAAARREQLVEAAIEVAVDVGLPATTIRKVAEQAGVALGTVHYAFDSKDELLFAVAGRLPADVQAAVTSSLRPDRDVARVLRRALRAFWGVAASTPDRQLLTYELVTWSLRGSARTGVAQRQYEHSAAVAGRLLDAVAEAAGVRWTLPRPTLVRMALTITDGVALGWLVDRDDRAALGALDSFADLVALRCEPLADPGAHLPADLGAALGADPKEHP